MVGIFSRLSGNRTGHRRAQSSLEEREGLQPNAEVVGSANVAAGATTTHGIEVAAEFKPIEHPIEPPDSDQPIKCPLPEPSILSDRIWKEGFSANARRRGNLPVMKESARIDSENTEIKQRPVMPKRLILPSVSAPEHHLLKMLEEYKEAED